LTEFTTVENCSIFLGNEFVQHLAAEAEHKGKDECVGRGDDHGAAAWGEAKEDARGEDESEDGKVQKHKDVHFMCANIFFES
jgi:hypothetical protein